MLDLLCIILIAAVVVELVLCGRAVLGKPWPRRYVRPDRREAWAAGQAAMRRLRRAALRSWLAAALEQDHLVDEAALYWLRHGGPAPTYLYTAPVNWLVDTPATVEYKPDEDFAPAVV